MTSGHISCGAQQLYEFRHSRCHDIRPFTPQLKVDYDPDLIDWDPTVA